MTDVLTPVKAPTSPAVMAASKKTLQRAVAAAVMLLAGVGGVSGLEVLLNAQFEKPEAPLSRSLTDLPRRIGIPSRYVAEKPDSVLDHEVVETLGTQDYLVREYRDLQAKHGDVGEYVNLNVNYYATGSSSPHVPEVCWAGAGQVQAPGSGETFEVADVPRKYGPPVTLRVRLISFLPPRATAPGQEMPKSADGEPLYTNVAYIFHVNGDYVSNPREVTSHFWKASYRYAYHCKIEITPMVEMSNAAGSGVVPALCTRTQAKEIVAQFLRTSIADVEGCLPDPAILTEGSPAGATAGAAAPSASEGLPTLAAGPHERVKTR